MVLLPVAIGMLMSPLSKRIGVWKFLHGLDPANVGVFPCSVPTLDDWGFTLEDLYGNGTGIGHEQQQQQQRQQTYRNRLWGQTAIVTGANSGTGYATSLALARLGVRVTMACRNPKKCENAAHTIRTDSLFIERSESDRGLSDATERDGYVTTATIDTSSLSSVRAFAVHYLEEHANKDKDDDDTLDMLFLNAGIGPQPLTEDGTNRLSEDGIELVFATNVVGHHLLYKLLEPLLLNTKGGRTTPARIVLTSSCQSYGTTLDYKVATDLETLNGDPAILWSHYDQSKLAQIYWARELTRKLDANNIDDPNNDPNDDPNNNPNDDPNSIVYVNAANPGAVATNIFKKIVSEERTARERDHGAANAVTKLLDWAVDVCTHTLAPMVLWTPEEGALTLLYLGTAFEELAAKQIRGRYFHPQSFLVTNHHHVYDNEDETNLLQAKVWNFLDELVAGFV